LLEHLKSSNQVQNMNNNGFSLKWKILLGITLTSVFAVIVSNVVTLRMEINEFNDIIERDSITLAKIIGGSTSGAMEFGDKVSGRTTINTLANSSRVVGSVIYTQNGRPFVWYKQGVRDNSADVPSDLPNSARRQTIRADDNYLELNEPIIVNGEEIASIYMKVSLNELQQAISNAVWASILTIAVISLLSAIISYFIQASIVKPISAAVAALRDIAEGEGDLTQRLPVNSNDEVGQLALWFNTFIERMHSVIQDFSNTATELNGSAELLSLTAKETEQGAVNQQAEIEKMVSAVREMSAVVDDVAHNVTQTADNAEEADKEATSGREVVTSTMLQIEHLSTDINTAAEVINKLRQETDDIGSVLDVIRGIAEQTNLLALNAAIEAARAGEQGRGFAVVADEVRTLASRTQSSTQEIQAMIEKLQSGAREAVTVMEKGTLQAEESVKQASDAGRSLEAITAGVSTIRDRTNQIASASEEQSSATREMESNIGNISEIAQRTSSGSVEIATSTAKLADMAANMERAVKQFKL
jgi:methyl-accepting chemotaxis protein